MFNILSYYIKNQIKCESSTADGDKNVCSPNYLVSGSPNIGEKLQSQEKNVPLIQIQNKFRDVNVPVEEYESEKYKLKFVQLVTRHGRRTPESARYPFSLWTCNSMENLITNKDIEKRPSCENGQLTVLGVQDLINVGQAYKSVFIDRIHFLDQKYNPDQIYIRSTDRERTISSARSLMHGLYGGQFSDNEEKSPKHTTFVIKPTEIEDMYPRSCDRYVFLKSILKKHKDVINEKKESGLQEFTDKVKKIFEDSKGFDSPFYVPRFHSYTGLVNSFDCFKNHGLPLPSGFTPEVIDRMYREAAKEFKSQRLFKDISILGIGRFIKDLSYQMKLKASNDSSVDKLKFAYYSGHDTTLGALLVAYDMYEDKHHPVTSSTLEFLLFEDATKKPDPSKPIDNQYVKVLFNQKVIHMSECKPKEVDGMCPLSEFLKISASLTPTDYENQCKISDEEKKRFLVALQNQ